MSNQTAETLLAAGIGSMQPENIPAMTIKPYYETKHSGVFYVGVVADKETQQPKHKEPEKLADEIRLIGRGIDENEGHYRIMEWRDKVTRQTRMDALPMGIIGTNECWNYMLSRGISVQSKPAKRILFADYLQNDGSNDRWVVTTKAGWCSDDAYILPNGEVLQASNKNAARKVIFRGDKSQSAYYSESGSLSDWQANIGRYAADNSRLCLALGSAFAAPLMRLLDIEGGGFHLFGDSSDGKTTSAKMALSVWGKADDLKLGWRGTDLGFSNVANARNDGLLVLDEIGEASPKVVSMTAYSVLNGRGKIQGAKEGGNRAINEWRVLLLSTGEKTLDGYLSSNNADLQAGQAARLPNIPANAGKGFGVFDVLHGFADGAAFSEHLNMAANQYYGTAGREFIRHLLADTKTVTSTAKTSMEAFLSILPPLSGQAKRVGTRFALVAAALALACQYGILSLTTEQIQVAIKQCFDAWLEREGTGKREDKKIMEQAIGFMQVNGFNRFDKVSKDTIPNTTPNLAGYREQQASDSETTLFYVIPDVFSSELGKGFDTAKVCEVLHAANEWLQKPNGRWQKQKRINGELQRFYVLVGTVPREDENSQ